MGGGGEMEGRTPEESTVSQKAFQREGVISCEMLLMCQVSQEQN